MKCLITGGSGYVGSSFIKRYSHKYSFKKFSLLSQDIESLDFCDVDCILHCAGLVHKSENINFDEYYKINVEYPLTLANKAKNNGVKHFVFISSIAVYGINSEIVNEKSLCSPVSKYGKSKFLAEQKLQELSNDDFSVSIIRPTMIYGKDAPGNMLKLVKLIERFPIVPFAGIKNKKSFIYIENLCCFIDSIILHGKNGVYLASDNESISTTNLVKNIAKELGRKTYLIKLPLLSTMVKMLKPSLYAKIYGNLEVNNNDTITRLGLTLPYDINYGIKDLVSSVSENRRLE